MRKIWQLSLAVGLAVTLFWLAGGIGVADALAVSPETKRPRIGLLSPHNNYFDLPLKNLRSEGSDTCRGERVTDTVQSGETWQGSDDREVVAVLGNGAQVFANGGDDLICVFGQNRANSDGYAGSSIFTGEGNNTVITYGGSNDITGGDGDDLVYLNGHNESATTQAGDDHIWALGATTSTAYGGSGNDLIIGSHGDDFIVGGSNDDVVLGNGGNDEIIGLYGDNKLFGGSGQDTIDGGADFDFCQDFDQNTVFTHCEVISQTPNPSLPESG